MKVVKRISDNSEIGIYLGEVLFIQEHVDGFESHIAEAEKARIGDTDCVYLCKHGNTIKYLSSYLYYVEKN